jgi:hypothetical protein
MPPLIVLGDALDPSKTMMLLDLSDIIVHALQKSLAFLAYSLSSLLILITDLDRLAL